MVLANVVGLKKMSSTLEEFQKKQLMDCTDATQTYLEALPLKKLYARQTVE